MGRLTEILLLAIAGAFSPAGADYVLETVDGTTLEYPSGSRALARAAYRIYLESRPRVEAALGISAGGDNVRITIAPNPAEFERIVREASGGPAPPERALAVALPARGQMVIKASSLEIFTDNSLLLTVRHELVHLVLGEAWRGKQPLLPRWLNEGLAEYVAGKDLSWRQRSRLQAAARSGTLPSLRRLSREFPAHEGGSAAYPQCLAFIRHTVSRFGEEALRGLIQRLLSGVSVEVAWKDETGVSLREVEEEWRARLGRKHSILKDLFYEEGRLSQVTIFRVVAILVVVSFIVIMVRRRRLLRRMDE